MRQKLNPQLGLFTPVAKTKIGKELEQMSRILDDTPELLQVIFDDLVFRFSKMFTLSDIKIKFFPAMHNRGRVDLLDPQEDTFLEFLFRGNSNMT